MIESIHYIAFDESEFVSLLWTMEISYLIKSLKYLMENGKKWLSTYKFKNYIDENDELSVKKEVIKILRIYYFPENYQNNELFSSNKANTDLYKTFVNLPKELSEKYKESFNILIGRDCPCGIFTECLHP